MSWAEIKLSEIGAISTGNTPSKQESTYYDKNDYPFIKPDLLNKNGIVYLSSSKEFLSSSGAKKARIANAGSVLVTCIGNIGNIGIAQKDVCFNQQINAIAPFPEVALSSYVAYAILFKKESLAAIANAAVVPIINKTDFSKFKIPLPPLEIQKKIAAVLEKADELRRKREEQIKRLDDLLQATFLDMFGDPVTNPKGWPKSSLESLCHKVTDGTHQPPKFVSEGIPFLFVSNIVNGFIDFDTEKFISNKTFEELTSRTPIEVGDILYSTVGSYGKAVLVDTTKKFSFQRHIAHIKPDPLKVQAEFLLTQLNSSGVKRQADSLARGIAQKTLNLRELKGFEIFLPSHEQQLEFIKMKKKIDEVAFSLKASYSNYIVMFNSLMQRAFKGGWS